MGFVFFFFKFELRPQEPHRRREGQRGGLVEAVPVTLLRVVLQLRADATHPVQEHWRAMVPVCGTGGDSGDGARAGGQPCMASVWLWGSSFHLFESPLGEFSDSQVLILPPAVPMQGMLAPMGLGDAGMLHQDSAQPPVCQGSGAAVPGVLGARLGTQ